MKLAFSTIACPNWSFNDIFSTAIDFGYDAIEIRGIASEMYAPNIKAFDKYNIEATKLRLNSSNLKISCLTSGACLAVPDLKNSAMAEAKEYIDLASKLGVAYVRVMPTSVPYKDGGDIELALKSYTELAEYAAPKLVTPLMETNGIFADTAILRGFMDRINCSNKGVLWDVNHPYRFNAESIEQTIGNISHLIKYVHIKDSKIENEQTVYKLIGYGDFPIDTVIKELKKIKYDGYLSLEWVKRWNNNLEEPTIVIPIYAGYMKAMLK